jgi:carbamoyl-phosphate synthase large subunit
VTKPKVNILLTAAGRRVSLLRSFRAAMNELGLDGMIYAGDAALSAPASYAADASIRLPRTDAEDYVPQLLSICENNKIGLLVSLIDTDLAILSKHRSDFEKLGVTLMICNEATNDICSNKIKTHEFFIGNNIKTPNIFRSSQISEIKSADLPVVVKPWDGSCSIGVNIATTLHELKFYVEKTSNAIVQEFIDGDEYTCDAYVDFSGKVRCIVPRKRLETRAGEVSKAITAEDKDIIEAVKFCVESLPHTIGCITVQCFKEKNGSISFIEINPRFGGGHPLSIHAGAHFPKWILQELTTGICDASFSCWQDDLAMLRFDDEIIVPGSEIR